MKSHIDCICLTSPHCVFSNVSSNGLPGKMNSHIGCICLTLWHLRHQSFSSGNLHLPPLKEFVPLWLCVVLCSNCCFKLIDFWSPIITWVNFSIAYFHFFMIERHMSGRPVSQNWGDKCPKKRAFKVTVVLHLPPVGVKQPFWWTLSTCRDAVQSYLAKVLVQKDMSTSFPVQGYVDQKVCTKGYFDQHFCAKGHFNWGFVAEGYFLTRVLVTRIHKKPKCCTFTRLKSPPPQVSFDLFSKQILSKLISGLKQKAINVKVKVVPWWKICQSRAVTETS